MCWVIIARALNFKMVALHSVKCQTVNVIEDNKIVKSTKDAKRLAEYFSKQRDEVFADSIKKKTAEHFLKQGWSFCWFNLKKQLKLLAHLDIGNQHNYNKMCIKLSLFTEFITEFRSNWVIISKQLLLKVKERSIDNIHIAFAKYLLIFIHYYRVCHFTILGQWNTKYASVIEPGKNKDRSDACDLWFLFQFLDKFFSNELKSPQNFCSGH